MSRPLIANKHREAEAHAFHRLVFKAHGIKCYWCHSLATDAAHIISRSQIGPKLRYACPAENGRPACRECHDLNTDHKLDFKLKDRMAAVRALNALNPKVALIEPID